jgi:hypothetical protein
MTAINTTKLSSFLREFYKYKNDKETFVLKLKDFHLTDEEVRTYYDAIRNVTRHEMGIDYWQIASSHLTRNYWFESVRELERNIHFSLDDTLNNDIEKLNETINTISQTTN